MGYRTCYYRCFTIGYASRAMVDAYKRCRDYLDAAISLVRPGRTTAEIAAVWPKAKEFGFPDEEAAFALQFGHGIGLAIWEKPVISRLVSLEHSHEIKPGMVFALETFWPASRRLERRAHRGRNRRHRNRPRSDHAIPGGKTAGRRRALRDRRWAAGDHARDTKLRPASSVVEMVEASARTEGVGRFQVAAPSRRCSANIMAHSIVMPALEMAQETGKLLSWRKKEGEAIAKGEPLLEVETDKAVVEIEAPADGILAGVKAHEGDVIPVGQTIAWIVQPGEKPPAERSMLLPRGGGWTAKPAATAALRQSREQRQPPAPRG